MDENFSIRDLEKRKRELADPRRSKAKKSRAKSPLPDDTAQKPKSKRAVQNPDAVKTHQEIKAKKPTPPPEPGIQQQKVVEANKTPVDKDSVPDTPHQREVEPQIQHEAIRPAPGPHAHEYREWPRTEPARGPADNSVNQSVAPVPIEEDGIDFQRFITAIVDKKEIAIAIVLGVFLTNLFLSIGKPAIYEAKAKILQKLNTANSAMANFVGSSDNYSIDTIKDLMKSAPVMKKVIKALNLDMSIASLSSRISIYMSANSDVIKVGAKDQKKDRSIAIVNAFARAFIEIDVDLKRKEALTTFNYAQDQLEDAKKKLSQAENGLKLFKQKYGLVELDSDMRQISNQLAQIDSQYRMAVVESSALEKKIERIKSEYDNQEAEVILNFINQKPLQKELVKLETELAQALTRYTDESPKVAKIKSKIAATKDLIDKNVDEKSKTVTYGNNPTKREFYRDLVASRSQMLAIEAKVEALRIMREEIKARLKGLPETEAKYLELERQKVMAEDLYDMLVEKREEARLAKELSHGNFELLEEAQGASKIASRVRRNTVIGLIAGIILAVASAILLDYIRNTIRSSRDILNRLGLNPLNSIPDLGSKKKLINPDPQRSMEGSFAFLRDYIKNKETGRYCRSILISSAGKGEGKKFVASNLALTYAVEEDSAVLVQGNLRDLDDVSDLEPHGADGEVPGFWEYLEGHAEIDDILYETHIENLYIIMPGMPGVTNPMKLFKSQRMVEMIKYLNERFGLTVFFTAEASNFSDASALASLVDGILMVIEYDKLNANRIKQAVSRIEAPGANILGGVINKAKKYNWNA